MGPGARLAARAQPYVIQTHYKVSMFPCLIEGRETGPWVGCIVPVLVSLRMSLPSLERVHRDGGRLILPGAGPRLVNPVV
jgi:hypothetical protein